MTVQDDLAKGSGNLERVFYVGESAGLLVELRKPTAEERRAMLREVVRIQDRAFIDRLVALDVRPQTALAVMLVPLVLVAWADEALDERERDAILRAAEERGVAAGNMARQALKASLERKPDPRLLPVWTAYVRRLWGCFTSDERWRMRQNLLQSTREVAEAAGGFLGLTSKVSPAERRVLEEFGTILD